MTGDDIREAISQVCPLVDPRLSEVEWDQVAAVLAALDRSDPAVDGWVTYIAPDGARVMVRAALDRSDPHPPLPFSEVAALLVAGSGGDRSDPAVGLREGQRLRSVVNGRENDEFVTVRVSDLYVIAEEAATPTASPTEAERVARNISRHIPASPTATGEREP